MKYTLLALSVLCLSFTFVRNVDFSGKEAPQAVGTGAPDEQGGTAGKTTGVSDIVTKALALKALLNTTQVAALEQNYSASLARKWSNLPCGGSCRNGVQFGTFSSAQLAAALDLIKTALSANSNDGYAEFEANRMAEAYLHANGGGAGYDSSLRWIAFLNEPSTTGSWMLQFGGHHYAANISIKGGHIIGGTPYFQGLEPLSFTYNGTSYAPLNDEHDALTAMLASLSSSQLGTANLNQTFSDCYMVPGETNGGHSTFPAKAGLVCSGLTTAQKNLVLTAIRHYVEDLDATTSAAIMAVYTSEIDNTYIGYTGNGTSGNASSFLNANTNYVRIDGPTVWIELACQNGVVLSGIHYHTIWRDHSHDYGVDFSGSSIDGTSSNAVAGLRSAIVVNVHPNPAAGQIAVTLPAAVSDATVKVVSAATGQTTVIATHRSGTSFGYDVSALPAGLYVLRVEDGTAVYTGKFTKL